MKPETITITILGEPVEARLDLGDEPRVEAASMGRLLEYSRPRDCRDLVRRLRDSGRLSEQDARGAAPRGHANYETEEPWLSERGALLVAAASETDRAWQVRTALVDFFLAHRRGQTSATSSRSTIDGESMFDQLFGAFDPKTMVKETRSDGVYTYLRRDLPREPAKPRTPKKRGK